MIPSLFLECWNITHTLFCDHHQSLFSHIQFAFAFYLASLPPIMLLTSKKIVVRPDVAPAGFFLPSGSLALESLVRATFLPFYVLPDQMFQRKKTSGNEEAIHQGTLTALLSQV